MLFRSNESVLMTEKTNHILDYERATHIIEEADFIGVGTCFCRHKNYHLGIPCKLNAPQAGPGQQTVQVRLPGPPPGLAEKGKALKICHEKKQGTGKRSLPPAGSVKNHELELSARSSSIFCSWMKIATTICSYSGL